MLLLIVALLYRALVEVEMMLYCLSALLLLYAFVALRRGAAADVPRPFKLPGGTRAAAAALATPSVVCALSLAANLADAEKAAALAGVVALGGVVHLGWWARREGSPAERRCRRLLASILIKSRRAPPPTDTLQHRRGAAAKPRPVSQSEMVRVHRPFTSNRPWYSRIGTGRCRGCLPSAIAASSTTVWSAALSLFTSPPYLRRTVRSLVPPFDTL